MGDVQDAGKKPWESKTVWVNLIMAIVAFIPVDSVQMFFIENQGFLPMLFTSANVILRLITKDPIQIK